MVVREKISGALYADARARRRGEVRPGRARPADVPRRARRRPARVAQVEARARAARARGREEAGARGHVDGRRAAARRGAPAGRVRRRLRPSPRRHPRRRPRQRTSARPPRPGRSSHPKRARPSMPRAGRRLGRAARRGVVGRRTAGRGAPLRAAARFRDQALQRAGGARGTRGRKPLRAPAATTSTAAGRCTRSASRRTSVPGPTSSTRSWCGSSPMAGPRRWDSDRVSDARLRRGRPIREAPGGPRLRVALGLVAGSAAAAARTLRGRRGRLRRGFRARRGSARSGTDAPRPRRSSTGFAAEASQPAWDARVAFLLAADDLAPAGLRGGGGAPGDSGVLDRARGLPPARARARRWSSRAAGTPPSRLRAAPFRPRAVSPIAFAPRRLLAASSREAGQEPRGIGGSGARGRRRAPARARPRTWRSPGCGSGSRRTTPRPCGRRRATMLLEAPTADADRRLPAFARSRRRRGRALADAGRTGPARQRARRRRRRPARSPSPPSRTGPPSGPRASGRETSSRWLGAKLALKKARDAEATAARIPDDGTVASAEARLLRCDLVLARLRRKREPCAPRRPRGSRAGRAGARSAGRSGRAAFRARGARRSASCASRPRPTISTRPSRRLAQLTDGAPETADGFEPLWRLGLEALSRRRLRGRARAASRRSPLSTRASRGRGASRTGGRGASAVEGRDDRGGAQPSRSSPRRAPRRHLCPSSRVATRRARPPRDADALRDPSTATAAYARVDELLRLRMFDEAVGRGPDALAVAGAGSAYGAGGLRARQVLGGGRSRSSGRCRRSARPRRAGSRTAGGGSTTRSRREASSPSRAKEFDLDAAVLRGLVRQESVFDAHAKSRAGAVGLMQLMPATAKSLSRSVLHTRYRGGFLYDPGVNARLGAAYLRRLVDQFDGSTVLALAAYNGGPIAHRAAGAGEPASLGRRALRDDPALRDARLRAPGAALLGVVPRAVSVGRGFRIALPGPVRHDEDRAAELAQRLARDPLASSRGADDDEVVGPLAELREDAADRRVGLADREASRRRRARAASRRRARGACARAAAACGPGRVTWSSVTAAPRRRASQPPARTSALPGSPTAVQMRMRSILRGRPRASRSGVAMRDASSSAKPADWPPARRVDSSSPAPATTKSYGASRCSAAISLGRLAAAHANASASSRPAAAARAASASRSASWPARVGRDAEHGRDAVERLGERPRELERRRDPVALVADEQPRRRLAQDVPRLEDDPGPARRRLGVRGNRRVEQDALLAERQRAARPGARRRAAAGARGCRRDGAREGLVDDLAAAESRGGRAAAARRPAPPARAGSGRGRGRPSSCGTSGGNRQRQRPELDAVRCGSARRGPCPRRGTSRRRASAAARRGGRARRPRAAGRGPRRRCAARARRPPPDRA